MNSDRPRGEAAREREQELRADRALFGLDVDEARELSALAGEQSLNDPDSFEIAAAAANLAMAGGESANLELPRRVRDSILAASRDFVRDRASAPIADKPASHAPQPATKSAPASVLARRELWGWFAAAAAILVAAWSLTDTVATDAPSDPRSLRDALLAQRAGNPTDVVQVAWTRGEDPTGKRASGEVLWSDRTQQGVMRFCGLAANDPAKSQYQLWIFDKDRDERYPVDGGVFDVPAGDDEVLTLIRAKLPVGQAVLFAITVEQPGGVVVSDRSRLPLLAKVE